MARNRGKWTAASRAYLENAQDQLEELHSYWPLTLRQVYYQLVASGQIENSRGQYQKLSRILTRARLDELVPWEALEDRARATHDIMQWANRADYVEDEAESVLRYYRRDILQTQPVTLEVWVEKDALSRICSDVSLEYGVPTVVARGFSSVSYLNDCRERVEQNAMRGQQTVLLYFGDMDPSGWEMLPAMMETLQVEMGLDEWVQGIRCALTPEQVDAYALPRNPDALKSTDSRARRYEARFGALAVELDAFSPSDLQSIVRESIEGQLDLSTLREEQSREHEEREHLRRLRSQVVELMAGA